MPFAAVLAADELLLANAVETLDCRLDNFELIEELIEELAEDWALSAELSPLLRTLLAEEAAEPVAAIEVTVGPLEVGAGALPEPPC